VERKTLVYLSYGGHPVQVAETTYGVLSARRAVGAQPGTDVLLYTDHPSLYEGLPVGLRPISPEELAAWAGPDGYLHRRKLEVVADALASTGGPVVFVDSDTWFRKPAGRLFERIGPGRTVLHLLEGTLEQGRAPDRELAAQLDAQLGAGGATDADGRGAPLSGRSPMWNSGVVGVHPADSDLVAEALRLTDEVYAQHDGLFTVEQLATGHAFAQGATVSPSSDVVYHYWHDLVREPFRRRLPSLLAETAGLPLEERLEVLHRARPRLVGRERARFLAKELYRATGRRTGTIRGSAS